MKSLKTLSFIICLAILQKGILKGQESVLNIKNDYSNTAEPFKYINITNISYGVGLGKGDRGSSGHSSFGVHSINGCIIDSKLSLGIGIGFDRLQISDNLFQSTFPFSIDLRYFFFNDPKLLFAGFEGGYSFNLNGDELGSKKGSFFIDPLVGFKPFNFKKFSVSVSLGVKIQQNTILNVWERLPKNETLLNFKTGIIF
jgi:hypothetical protein